MNVFIVGTPIETAMALDHRRLNKQIIECRQIIKALNGETQAWANHPATRQYKNHVEWLKNYLKCLERYREGLYASEYYSSLCELEPPEWHTREYIDNMKRRLYTKDNEHYKQWADLGESNVNMYYVDGKWKYYYNNGKQIKK